MKLKFLAFFLILTTILSLASCVPSKEAIEKQESGEYIDTADYSGVKWVCREMDMYFYTLDFGNDSIIGEYKAEGESFRLLGNVESWGGLNFIFYAQDNQTESDVNIPGAKGFIYTEYVYENDTMVCTVVNEDGIDVKATTLTFDKNEVSKTVKDSWKCNEIDMKMSSFNEIQGYFKGEIVIDGQNCNFLAFEVVDGKYRFHIENGKINNLVGGTYPLIDMTVTEKDGNLVGTLSEYTLSDKINFPHWNFDNTTFTFTRQ